MKGIVRTLFVEDSEKDAALIMRELKRAGLELETERVATAPALAEALARSRWDLVLADFELPGFDGFVALQMVREVDPFVPCIVVSGRIGEEMAVDAMRSGAADFVPKDRLLRLAPVVQRELRDAEVRRAQMRDSRRIAAQQAISALLADGREVLPTMPRALAAIAENLGWDLAAFWRWDPDERLLRCSATWSSEGLGGFDVETRGSAVPSGTGLAGRAFAKRAPIWVRDLAEGPADARSPLAAREGLHGALAVPVPISGELCCVIELFARAKRERDAQVLETALTVAAQLGQAIGRERAIEALRASEARKAAVLDTSLDAVITIDHRGRVLEFNPAAERIFGYTRDEAIGKDVADLLVPRSLRDAQRRGMARYLTTGEGAMIGRRIELPAMRKDGTEFPAEIAVNRVNQAGPPVFTGFVRDVTESVKLFRAVQAAEARQRVLAEVGAALVQSLDTTSMLPRVARLLASELSDWCTIHLVDERGALRQVAAAHRTPSKNALLESLWSRRPIDPDCTVGPIYVTRTASPQLIVEVTPGELDRIARDPEERTILQAVGVASYVGVPLVARGSTLGALSLAIEDREHRFGADDLALALEIGRRCAVAIDNGRLYREVQDSLRARDDFIVIAAHELQTPLTPLRMRAQELARVVDESAGRCIDAGDLIGTVRAIDRSSRRVTELVERLLDVSRVMVGRVELEMTRFDLVALARAIVVELGEELERVGSDVAWDVPDEPIEGRWDRKRIALAIRSLLSNALKFGPGRPIEVGVRVEDDQVRVSVRDHGPGLAPEESRRLFERFVRPASVRHYGGFGLGLWIVRQIAEEHGGRVEVSSEPGSGSRFSFVLPRNE